jgi:hypothetical protein
MKKLVKRKPKRRPRAKRVEKFVPLFYAGIKRPRGSVVSLTDDTPSAPETFWD